MIFFTNRIDGYVTGDLVFLDGIIRRWRNYFYVVCTYMLPIKKKVMVSTCIYSALKICPHSFFGNQGILASILVWKLENYFGLKTKSRLLHSQSKTDFHKHTSSSIYLSLFPKPLKDLRSRVASSKRRLVDLEDAFYHARSLKTSCHNFWYIFKQPSQNQRPLFQNKTKEPMMQEDIHHEDVCIMHKVYFNHTKI